ncbi:unnamed protein product [Orchesella dallaii]|uniref:PPPDE domain-containing protein n=1 Tax=Orchesella dallaii TaxID=48710 RepID=A0ABP1RJ21_9HEXA
MAQQVQLYIYDLSKGMVRAISQSLLGVQLDGLWHTGVVIFGREYFFGGGASISATMDGVSVVGNPALSGIRWCAPGTTILGQPQQMLALGETEIPESVVADFLSELSSSTFRADTYSLFEHNCNHFSNEFSQFLTGNSIPDNIVNLPQAVLNTPIGNMIRAMMGGSDGI